MAHSTRSTIDTRYDQVFPRLEAVASRA